MNIPMVSVDINLIIECYTFSHASETTHWLDPRLSKVQKSGALDCEVDGK